MSSRASRLLLPLLLVVAVTGVVVAPAQGAGHAGKKVRQAWPEKSAHRPKTGLTRWLARQVGPRVPVTCSKRPAVARARCSAPKRKGQAAASSLKPVSMMARAARGGPFTSKTERVVLSRPGEGEELQLIRSFEIPVDDPSYERLLNWSYTYDSAVAATAFDTAGLKEQAGRLLDQLAALQQKDGSIEFAFNVLTGESSGTIRSGSVAFAAMAFTEYDSTFGGTLYLDDARRAVDYLLSLRNEEGLVRGGPDVEWVSTQHNMLTLFALTGLASELESRGEEEGEEGEESEEARVEEAREEAAYYREAAAGIAKAINSQLIVSGNGEPSHFREGVGDEVVPLDTQALGVIYARYIRNPTLAKEVYEYTQKNFAIDGRSIELSSDPATYNMTYEAKGPFTGYRPYIGEGAPDVLWFEGTAEMRFAAVALRQRTEKLDASMNSWWDITRKQGLAPLGADRTITGNPYNEYHVWPTAAAGAWMVLSRAAVDAEWAVPKPVEKVPVPVPVRERLPLG